MHHTPTQLPPPCFFQIPTATLPQTDSSGNAPNNVQCKTALVDDGHDATAASISNTCGHAVDSCRDVENENSGEMNRNGSQQKKQNGKHIDTQVANVPIPTRRNDENLFVTAFCSIERSRTNSSFEVTTDESTYVPVSDISEFDEENSLDQQEYDPAELVNYADTMDFVEDDGDDFNNIDDINSDENI